ncbi:MAG: FkbM family methyltransferase [Caldilineaceae bacterium]
MGSHTNGCWLGSYEFDKQQLFSGMISTGNTVFDIGAHVGFYTLLSSVLVGEVGHVFAFEPLPRNLHYLHRHITLNKMNNVTVIPAAVADRSGHTLFQQVDSSAQGHFSITGNLKVAVVALDEQVSTGQLPKPDVIKMDVEGAEAAVLRGARQTLQQYRPIIFLATHGAAIREECFALLQELNYSLTPIDERPLAATDEILAVPAEKGKTTSR